MKPDILIVGAGLIGCTLALMLADKGIEVSLIEKTNLNQRLKTAKHDGRTIALSYGSKQILASLGIWRELKKYAGEIEQIRVTDQNSHMYMHMDNKQFGGLPLGYMVPAQELLMELTKAVLNESKIKIYDDFTDLNILENNNHRISVQIDNTISQIKSIKDSGADERFKSETEGVYKQVHDRDRILKKDEGSFKSGNWYKNRIEGKLLIAADGKKSTIRKIGNFRLHKANYTQQAMVFNIKHELTHMKTACQIFYPEGPLAILPTRDEHISAIVWSTNVDLLPTYQQLTDEELADILKLRSSDYLGKIEIITERISYPLSVSYAMDVYNGRIALVGDALHAMHPIAGQGLNLGFRDLQAMQMVLADAYSYGADVGSYTVLHEYEKLRLTDNNMMVSATDFFTKIFSNNILPLKIARRIGLKAVNNFDFLKNAIADYARG